MSNDYTIQSVQKALRILEVFSVEEPELSLSTISIYIGQNKSSTLRLLYTLRESGFVDYDEDTKMYSLSIKMFQLGSIKMDSLNWRSIAKKYLQKLSDDVGLICYLGIRDGNFLVMLDRIFPHTVPTWAQLMVRAGGSMELYSTGIGRLFLSEGSDQEVQRYLESVPVHSITSKTITDKEELLNKVREARESGFSFICEENEEYISSICIGIRDYQGKMIAGISLGGISDIIYGPGRPELIEKLKRTADNISSNLGYRP